ncbi:peptidyl-lysine oxidation [Branchiostoma belcheri]|nr:peptidyl-lysine oxidation [Branchiostoma belcheri]
MAVNAYPSNQAKDQFYHPTHTPRLTTLRKLTQTMFRSGFPGQCRLQRERDQDRRLLPSRDAGVVCSTEVRDDIDISDRYVSQSLATVEIVICEAVTDRPRDLGPTLTYDMHASMCSFCQNERYQCPTVVT